MIIADHTPPQPPAPAKSRLSRALKAMGLSNDLPGKPISAKVLARIEDQKTKLQPGAEALYRTDGSLITQSLVGNLISGVKSAKLDLSHALLVRRTDLKHRDFEKMKFVSADFRLSDLSGVRLFNCDVARADLRGIRADHFKALGSHICHANFAGARLYRGEFKNTRLRDTNFTKARLQGTSFEGCNLGLADFTNAIFRQSGDESYPYRKYKVSFKNADLTGARFSFNARFGDVDLTGAKLDGVIIIDAKGQPMPNAELRENGSIVVHRTADWRKAHKPADNPADKSADKPAPPKP